MYGFIFMGNFLVSVVVVVSLVIIFQGQWNDDVICIVDVMFRELVLLCNVFGVIDVCVFGVIVVVQVDILIVM